MKNTPTHHGKHQHHDGEEEHVSVDGEEEFEDEEDEEEDKEEDEEEDEEEAEEEYVETVDVSSITRHPTESFIFPANILELDRVPRVCICE